MTPTEDRIKTLIDLGYGPTGMTWQEAYQKAAAQILARGESPTWTNLEREVIFNLGVKPTLNLDTLFGLVEQHLAASTTIKPAVIIRQQLGAARADVAAGDIGGAAMAALIAYIGCIGMNHPEITKWGKWVGDTVRDNIPDEPAAE